MNEHLPAPEPVNEEREKLLKASILVQLKESETLTDLAKAKSQSLGLDLRTNYPAEVHQAIIAKFEDLLVKEVSKLDLS
jgi:hypothetical protein